VPLEAVSGYIGKLVLGMGYCHRNCWLLYVRVPVLNLRIGTKQLSHRNCIRPLENTDISVPSSEKKDKKKKTKKKTTKKNTDIYTMIHNGSKITIMKW